MTDQQACYFIRCVIQALDHGLMNKMCSRNVREGRCLKWDANYNPSNAYITQHELMKAWLRGYFSIDARFMSGKS